jgi:geranylgeranyl diphosphate synthase type II
MNRFEYFLNYFSEKIKTESVLIGQRDPVKLYEPISYSLNMGGKRIRPVLLLMAYNLFKPDYEKALPAAFAIELFHNFTLLHDDIMDNAILRRNRDTVHIKYSKNAAILSGDAMSILSYEYISKCKSGNRCKILELFTQTALQICDGQQFDMDYETNNRVTVDDYIKMIGLKTAVLLAASLKLGALVADAPDADANCLYEFGFNLGLAFQLQDDLLDTFGNRVEFGKNIGGDIVSNKKTFLLLNALILANNEQARKLEMWLKTNEFDRNEKIREVTSIFTDLGIEDITLRQIDTYFQIAHASWEKLNVGAETKKGLLDVANLLMNRKN